MGNEGSSYRRIRLTAAGTPVEGLYDSVVDRRLAALIEAARTAGLQVGMRELKGRDSRLLLRALAETLVEAIDSRLTDGSTARTDLRERD